MFRGSVSKQEFTLPEVRREDPEGWPPASRLAENFWGFVSHGYKGYHYYTGTDFPADKPSEAQAAYTRTHLLVFVRMRDPVMREALENARRNERGFQWADHVTVNLITPSLDRYLFAVNPAGKRYSEKNLQRNAGLDFRADVRVEADHWQALFAIPFRGLGMDAPEGSALAFDIVRQEQGDAAISTLTKAPVTPPYNYIYEYPVFHFSSLFLGSGKAVAPGLFGDATEGLSVRRLSPEKVVAGDFCEIAAEITLGRHGLRPGGRIRLRHATAVLNCGVFYSTLPLDWENAQVDNPRGSGYLSLDGSEAFRIETDGGYSELTYTGKTVLPEGTKLTVRLGARRHGGPGIRAARATTPEHPLVVNADPLARRVFEPLRPWPAFPVVNGAAVDLVLSNPGAVPAGEPFELCLRAVDRLGNLAEDFCGTVELFCDAEKHSFPEKIRLAPGDRGVKILSGCIEDRGVFSFAARSGLLSGQGNFMATDGSFGEGRILYGDVHCHTCTSDGYRTPEQKVEESRRLRGLHFMAIADHDFDQSPEKWNHYARLGAEHDDPGRFVCFLAHEWTPSAGHGTPFHREHPGHYVLLYPGFEGRLFRASDQRTNTPEKLFREVRKAGDILVIPHYHGRRPPIDPELSPALEIAAWDGKVSETEETAKDSVFSSLNAGCRVGIIAGTDHGGEGLTAYRNGEMFAVRVAEFSRDGIREGLRRRRTVGIMHTRVLLSFRMNEAEMGEEVAVPPGTERRFEVKAAARPYPAKIELIRNGVPIDTYSNVSGNPAAQNVVRCTFVDNSLLEAPTWYLARVTLHGSERCWSSPIWALPARAQR